MRTVKKGLLGGSWGCHGRQLFVEMCQDGGSEKEIASTCSDLQPLTKLLEASQQGLPRDTDTGSRGHLSGAERAKQGPGGGWGAGT